MHEYMHMVFKSKLISGSKARVSVIMIIKVRSVV